LTLLGFDHRVDLKMRDLFSAEVMSPTNADKYDSIVFSEVLEHVEKPLLALKTLYHLAKPGGLIWINVPANAPAPDHIFLLRDPAHAAEFVTEAGFEITGTAMFAQAGVSVDRAIRQQLAISCVVIGRKPG
jgi:2-polyprenyl-3-methyl-5-hydroxy-6-metoxy-1,4-benzoquinol methylase